jgi:hypothetical protein
MYFTSDYIKDIQIPLKNNGIDINSRNRFIIEHTIKTIAKEFINYDEKAYLKILDKYGIL